jgi:hypothetical protein
MSDSDKIWQRLVKAARQAPATPPAEIPLGFATRIAARWAAGAGANGGEVWLWFSGRALLYAALVMAGILALNYPGLSGAWEDLNSAGPVMETLLML